VVNILAQDWLTMSNLLEFDKVIYHGSVRCCLDSLSTEYFVPVYFDLQDKASASLGRLLYELSVAISQILGPVIAGFIWYPFERFGYK